MPTRELAETVERIGRARCEVPDGAPLDIASVRRSLTVEHVEEAPLAAAPAPLRLTSAPATIRSMAATRTDRRLTADLPAAVRARAARPSRVSALVISAALVAASTAFVAAVTPSVPARSAGVFYLLAVLGVSSIYGLWWGLATSLASALAFNFFFLPPAHTLVIDSSSDWLALAAFAVTAVVTSDLAARERRGREEAARRAEEARLGERFATAIATAANLDDALAGLGDEAAQDARGGERRHRPRAGGDGWSGCPAARAERAPDRGAAAFRRRRRAPVVGLPRCASRASSRA